MRKTAGDVFCHLIVAVLFMSPFSLSAVEVQPRQCDANNVTAILQQCHPNERCVQKSNNTKGLCECQRDFQLVMEVCVPVEAKTIVETPTAETETQTSSGGGSVAAGLLIPTFLIIAGVLLYFGARRYKWLQRVRQYRQSRYGNVLVTRNDDDDDDPPIA